MSKKKKRPEGPSATECLAAFGDLPDGAALAAAADMYGKGYGTFIADLGRENRRKR